MSQSDDALRLLTETWRSTARYSVVKIRRGTRTVVAEGKTWSEAVTAREVEEKAVKAAPDYRAVMSRTIVVIELERS